MADQQVRIVLAVDAAGVVSGAKTAESALGGVEKAAKKVGDGTAAAGKRAADGLTAQTTAADTAADATQNATHSLEEQASAASSVSTALMGLGVVAVGTAAAAGKAAIGWESDFAGVKKTVDGTAQEMGVLEGELRKIATTAPVTHTEIAGVAEAAGQLGVAREDVAEFSRVMLDLGVTTNLSAQEAAMSLKQFMNIMGSSADSVERIGSAVVGLGNNMATTEADIVGMSQRLAGAGKQARMSEPEVLAMAAAMSSVGIEAEAGGTAMSLTLKQIDGMVRSGGPKLELLGQIAGTSGKQFAEAWGENAAQATNQLVEGLGRMSAQGEDVNGVLDQLGFKGIRQADTLLRLAGASQAAGNDVGLLSEALRIGSEEFERNTALQIEAEQRYGTTASKAQIAANQIKDAFITMGQAMLPAINDGIQVVSDLATAFGSLPSEVQGTIGGLTGLIGVMAISAGGAIKAAQAYQSAKTALAALGTSMRTVGLTGGAIGLAITAIGLAVGALASHAAKARAYQDDLRGALQQTNGELRDQNGLFHESVRAIAVKRAQEEGLLDLASRHGIELSKVTDAMLGDAAARQEIVAVLDTQIAKQEQLVGNQNAVTGAYDAEQTTLTGLLSARDRLVAGLDRSADATADAVAAEEQHAAAMGGSADAAGEDAAATEEAARAKAELAEQTAAAEQALRDYIDAMYAESNANLAALDSELALNSAMMDISDRAKVWKEEATKAGESTKDAFDKTTRAGQENNKVMMRAVAIATEQVQTAVAQGASVEEIIALDAKHREELTAKAREFGLTEAAAAAYVTELMGVPPDVTTLIEARTEQGMAAVAEWEAALGKLPPEVLSEVKAALARGDLAAAEAALNNAARARTAQIRIVVSGSPNTPAMGRTIAKAAGGIVGFGDGGFSRIGDVRNAHRPEIVPSGTWRVFGEDETGGEAYIPLRDDWRRPRARAILRETAARLGMVAYADGGLRSVAASGSLDTTVGRLGDASTLTLRIVAETSSALFPLQEIAALTTEAQKAARALAPFAAATEKATTAHEKAQARLDAAQKKSDDAKKALKTARLNNAGKKGKKRNTSQIVALQKAEAKASEELKKAKEAEKKASDKLKDAKDKESEYRREAEQSAADLASAMQRLAESARRLSDSYYDAALQIKDDEGLSALMQGMSSGASQIRSFTADLIALRASDLDETLIQHLIGMGAEAGSALAREIKDSDAAGQLNKLSAELRAASDALGMVGAIGQAKQDGDLLAASVGLLVDADFSELEKKLKALESEKRIQVFTEADLAAVKKTQDELAKVKDKTVTVETLGELEGAQSAKAAVDAVQSKTVVITTIHKDVAEGGASQRLAAGGLIDGPGGPTDDLVPILASAGEYMLRASSVDYYGIGVVDDINHQRIRREDLPRYAGGGEIGAPPRTYSYVSPRVAPQPVGGSGLTGADVKAVARELAQVLRERPTTSLTVNNPVVRDRVRDARDKRDEMEVWV